jgi:hypothetical protein
VRRRWRLARGGDNYAVGAHARIVLRRSIGEEFELALFGFGCRGHDLRPQLVGKRVKGFAPNKGKRHRHGIIDRREMGQEVPELAAGAAIARCEERVEPMLPQGGNRVVQR